MNKMCYIYVRIRIEVPIATVELWLLSRTDNILIVFTSQLQPVVPIYRGIASGAGTIKTEATTNGSPSA